MISHEYRCIFIHIPRTGGSSIENIIWPGERSEAQLWMGLRSTFHNKYQTGGLQHLLASQIKQEVGADIFKRYFKFTFVRNPWEKAISQYAYLRDARPELCSYLGLPERPTFLQYLRRTIAKTHVQWERQLRFVNDDDGRPAIDFMGRFETLARDAATIFTHLGITARELPHVNASSHGAYADYFSQDARQLFDLHYAEDIEKLAYRFETIR